MNEYITTQSIRATETIRRDCISFLFFFSFLFFSRFPVSKHFRNAFLLFRFSFGATLKRLAFNYHWQARGWSSIIIYHDQSQWIFQHPRLGVSSRQESHSTQTHNANELQSFRYNYLGENDSIGSHHLFAYRQDISRENLAESDSSSRIVSASPGAGTAIDFQWVQSRRSVLFLFQIWFDFLSGFFFLCVQDFISDE